MIREIEQQAEWDALVAGRGGHPLQLWAWGELKKAHGPWRPTRLAIERRGEFIGGAQILARKMPGPFKRLFYLPRGPFCKENNRGAVLGELADWAKNRAGLARDETVAKRLAALVKSHFGAADGCYRPDTARGGHFEHGGQKNSSVYP